MKFTIIGCGNMGSALAQRLSYEHSVSLYDHHPEKAKTLEKDGFGKAYTQLNDAVQQADAVILAIKPQSLKEAAPSIRSSLSSGNLVISLLSGTSIETLKCLFPHNRIVRMMPNLPLIYGQGAIGLTAESSFDEQDRLNSAFTSLGSVFWVSEKKLEAFTALAGSGPAFIFVIAEAIVDSGIAMGLTAKESQDMTYQMLLGSAYTLKESNETPSALKWRVTSPQGTTIAGIRQLEEGGLRGKVMETFLATYKRTLDLLGTNPSDATAKDRERPSK